MTPDEVLAKQTQGNQPRQHDLDEIIAELNAVYTGKLPEEALRAAQRRRDEITPRLIHLIEQATQTIRAEILPRGTAIFLPCSS